MQGLTGCFDDVPVVCGAKKFSPVVHMEEAGQARDSSSHRGNRSVV